MKKKLLKSKTIGIFFFLGVSWPNAFSQTEDFYSFIKQFCLDSSFQQMRTIYPLEVISWDYENDDESVAFIDKKDLSNQVFPRFSEDCSDGFLFVTSNVPLKSDDMVLEIRGITDSSEKYWFSVIDNKWFLVKYRNYDYGS
jgi:hypothetical protein